MCTLWWRRYLAEMLIGFIRNEAALMLLSGTAGTQAQWGIRALTPDVVTICCYRLI